MKPNELADYLHEFMFNEVDYDEDKHNQAQLMLRKQQSEIESLETEIFVKDAIRKSYKEALEQIATGEIAGESTNYKDTVYVMRQIASDALELLRKAQEK